MEEISIELNHYAYQKWYSGEYKKDGKTFTVTVVDSDDNTEVLFPEDAPTTDEVELNGIKEKIIDKFHSTR